MGLRLLRHSRAMTARDLARKTGLCVATLSAIETGQRALDPATERLLLRGLGIRD